MYTWSLVELLSSAVGDYKAVLTKLAHTEWKGPRVV